jgi:hypothetical protein
VREFVHRARENVPPDRIEEREGGGGGFHRASERAFVRSFSFFNYQASFRRDAQKRDTTLVTLFVFNKTNNTRPKDAQMYMMWHIKSCKNSEKKTHVLRLLLCFHFICCFLFFYLFLLCCDTGRTRSCRIDIDRTRE